ncbi:Protein fantom [Anthophora plagiata]
MADDPNRDILPVRDICVDTCRSSIGLYIDPRERHIVTKLDRYQLEDRYLRLLEEANHLKKVSNSQEDKIKRLATKLMRVTANPRPYAVALDVYEDKNKIIALELENSKLKDKMSVLRNQLLSHTIGSRSSSRSRNPQARSSSGRLSCRSENSRTKVSSCQCIIERGNNDIDAQNNLDKIEELESEKKELTNRIAELEKELSVCTAASQREKTAENVEYIRVWRQMKQLNDKLIAAENENESLNVRINDLKRTLEETTKSNEEITTELLTEKKRMAEMDEEMLKAKESQQSLREKEEQINDLMNEMKILQQHNNELIELSSKYSDVEVENKELKKKLTKQLDDQENLKTAFNTEQANIVALQTSNEQLFGKLHELQKNIDTLTVQLTTFQNQAEKQETPKETQITTKQTDSEIPATTDKYTSHKDIAIQAEQCSKCCETLEKILQVNIATKETKCNTCCNNTLNQSSRVVKMMDNSSQTESKRPTSASRKDQGSSNTKQKSKKEESSIAKQNPQPPTNPEPALTPEKMLKLLEQAQINRSSQKSTSTGVKEILDQTPRHSDREALVQVNQENPGFQAKYQQRETNKMANEPRAQEKQLVDSNKILSVVFNILQEYCLSYNMPNEIGTLYRECAPIEQRSLKDANNNIANGSIRIGCNAKRLCSSPYEKQRPDKFERKIFSGIKKYNRPVKPGETNECTCSSSMKCNANSDCEGRCCDALTVKMTGKKSPKNPKINPASNVVTFSDHLTKNVPRQLQDDSSTYKSWERRKSVSITEEDDSLQQYVEQLDKYKDIVNDVAGIPLKEIVDRKDITETMACVSDEKELLSDESKKKSSCSPDCINDCMDASGFISDTFPMIIADGQGLVELHIVSLQLSTCAKQILYREGDINNVSLFVSWDIWNQETAYTPTLKCPKLNYNSSFVYRISDLCSFFNYVLLEFVIFEVNVYHEDSENYIAARGKLCIKDILDYPQNKLHYIAPVNSVLPCTSGMNLGQLSLWVRLSCDVEKVEEFKKKRGLHSPSIEEPMHPVLPMTRPSKIDLFRTEENGSTESVESKVNHLQLLSKEHISKKDDTPSLTFKDESSDTSGEIPIGIIQSTIEKSSLTVVKESEEEMENTLSDHRQVDNSLISQKDTFPSVIQWKSPSEGILKDPTRDSNSITKETEDTSKSDTAMTTSSVLEFNAMITNEKQTETAADPVRSAKAESIRDLTNVLSEKNWEKYKERSRLTFTGIDEEDGSSLESVNDSQLEKDTIIIEVVSLTLFPQTNLMQNEEYQLLYIEYCFLGFCGAEMETVSLQKPKPPNQQLAYNFKRKFRVDEETHALQNNILRAMLDKTTNPNIKFILVCEPLPNETDTKECVEVGFANFNIREYALMDSEKFVSLPVYNPEENEQIGLLKISVLGLNTIRQFLARRESDT